MSYEAVDEITFVSDQQFTWVGKYMERELKKLDTSSLELTSLRRFREIVKRSLRT